MSLNVEYIFKVLDRFSGPLDRINRSIEKTEQKMSALSDKADKLGKSMMKVGAVMSAAVTFPLQRLARSSVDASIKMDALQNKMAASLGSSEKGKKQLEKLRMEADRIGVSFVDLSEGFAGFSASATRAGMTLSQTEDVFINMAESAQSMKMPGEKVKLIFRALEQIAGKGTVQMEELKLQLGDSLPGAVTIAAKSMGVTTAEFMKMVEKGEVLSNEFLPKFAKTIRSELGGSFDDASKSALANINRMNNSLFDMRRSIAASGLMDVVVKLANGIKFMSDKFNEASPSTKKTVVILGVLAAILPPLILGLGAVVVGIGMLLSPIGIAIVLGSIFFGVIATLSRFLAELAVKYLPMAAKAIKDGFIGAFSAVKSYLVSWVTWFNNIIGGVIGKIQGITNSAARFVGLGGDKNASNTANTAAKNNMMSGNVTGQAQLDVNVNQGGRTEKQSMNLPLGGQMAGAM